MKYIIIGSGPTGLSLANTLSNNGYDILVIEKDNQLGGSWNSQWINGKYWSENSPRVLALFKNTKKFLDDLGFKDSDYGEVYGNFFETNYKLFLYVLNFFNLNDLKIILKSTFKYRKINEDITLQNWIDNSNLSEKAKKGIKIASVTISDRPDKTNVNDFFCSFSPIFYFKQFKDPNKWHTIIEKNINVIKNTEVVQILEDNKRIKGVKVKNLLSGKYDELFCDKVILCTQSNGLLNILKNSSDIIKNNWMSFNDMNNWCSNTFYNGFGFQLHFKEKLKFPNMWCWSCVSEWTVILLPVSNWLNEISKNKDIKTVWSCCIVDLDTKSSKINKTANDCSKKEVLIECLKQINNSYKIPKPYKVTTSNGLEKIDNKWNSKNTGFTRGSNNFLPIKGKLDNLYALGCFTQNNISSISYMETAILSTVNYLNKYEKNINGFHNKKVDPINNLFIIK